MVQTRGLSVSVLLSQRTRRLQRPYASGILAALHGRGKERRRWQRKVPAGVTLKTTVGSKSRPHGSRVGRPVPRPGSLACSWQGRAPECLWVHIFLPALVTLPPRPSPGATLTGTVLEAWPARSGPVPLPGPLQLSLRLQLSRSPCSSGPSRRSSGPQRCPWCGWTRTAVPTVPPACT